MDRIIARQIREMMGTDLAILDRIEITTTRGMIERTTEERIPAGSFGQILGVLRTVKDGSYWLLVVGFMGEEGDYYIGEIEASDEDLDEMEVLIGETGYIHGI